MSDQSSDRPSQPSEPPAPDPAPPGGMTPPPPPPSASGTEPGWSGTEARPGNYGGPMKRLGARIIDGLIVGIPLAVVLTLAGSGATGFVAALLTTVVNLAYFVAMESSQRGTIGKRLLGMSVVSTSGVSLSPEASFRRNWWLLLGLVPFVGGFASLAVAIYIAVTISNDARNRGFHDKMADAVVFDR